MRTFRITSEHGEVSWGLWCAESEKKALELLKEDMKQNQGHYHGDLIDPTITEIE